MLVGGDKEFDSDVFYSSVYKAGQYEGSQYALPMECNPTLMFVNKTLLQKEGIKSRIMTGRGMIFMASVKQ